MTVTVTTPGQNARPTFNGTAGQRVSLSIGSVTIPYSGVYLYKPDGTTLFSQTTMTTVGLFMENTTLPASGTYQILINPQTNYTGNATLTLYDCSDVTGTITAGGSPLNLTITSPGQNARVTFNGTASQRVSLKVDAPPFPSGNTTIFKPDGNVLISAGLASFIDTQTLPTTGTYAILMDPTGPYTGALTVTLYDVPPDAGGVFSAGGPALTVTVTTPGQNARPTFNGTAGQRVSLTITSVTIPYSGVYIYKPDGTALFSQTVMTTAGLFMDNTTLPASGTYAMLIDPQTNKTGSATLTLYDASDVTGTITPGGSSLNLTIASPGQSALVTFSGTASQGVSLKVVSPTLPYSNATIYKPDGSVLVSTGLGSSGGFINTQTLPTTGTYSILIDPSGANTGALTLTLYEVPADLSGTITIGGSSVAVTIATPGQNGQWTFSGTAGQQATVRVTSNTMSTITVSLLSPSGAVLTSAFASGSTITLATQTLPTTGTYTIVIDPYQSNIGSLTLSVTSP